MSWEIQFRHGVHLPQIGWSLDAHRAVDRSFVSHAHFDHLARHREVICSPGTARLMHARMPSKRTERRLKFGQTEVLTADTSITLYPAGHILGSAQCLLNHEQHGTLLYTGDFKLRPGLVAEPCATPQADTLIMETTFGRPAYVFPPVDQVRAQLIEFCHATLAAGATPVLLCYSLGKSQETLQALAPSGLPVMLHRETFRLTQVHEQLGVKCPPYREFDAAELAGHVVICPPQSAGGSFFRKILSRRTALISGWALDPRALYRHRCDAAFPLSDHADFPELLEFVERVRPRRVFTLHGFAADFASELRTRGYDARALSEPDQLELKLPS